MPKSQVTLWPGRSLPLVLTEMGAEGPASELDPGDENILI